MPHGTPMVCQWVPMENVMGSPWGIGITMRFPKHPQYSYIPKHPQFGYIQAHTQTISISRGGHQTPAVFVYSQKPTVWVYSGTYPNNWYFRREHQIPAVFVYSGSYQKMVFPRGTKYPQYSYIQAQTKHFVSQGGKPNARSIRIFRNRPNTWYFRGGGTKYPQYSYIQAQTKQLPEYTNNVVFGVHPLA